MDKLHFLKKAFLWTAIVSAIVFTAVGFIAPIEAGMSVFGHILKTFVMWVWVTIILEVFTYYLAQLLYDRNHGYKEKYGKDWFWKGIMEDLAYIKEKWSWKKAGRVALTYLLFFAVVLGMFYLLDRIVP